MYACMCACVCIDEIERERGVGEVNILKICNTHILTTLFVPQMLLLEGSDHSAEYSKEEKVEFLFRLFKHLQLGGCVNQVRTSSPY